MYPQIILKKGKEESLKRFHPWVFSGAIQAIEEGIEEGDTVCLVNRNGDFIAVGHYQEGSIAVRVLTFEDREIDDDFWHSRISSALKMRQSIGIADSPSNNTYRLVHGEGDNLPGLIIDVYGDASPFHRHAQGQKGDCQGTRRCDGIAHFQCVLQERNNLAVYGRNRHERIHLRRKRQ